MDNITYAMDIPSEKDYLFDEFFNDKDEDEEKAKGANTRRPNITIWNQGGTPACTCFSATHIYNGYNILEDNKYSSHREEENPMVFWNRFCTERNNFDSGSSIQTMAKWFKNNGLIEGYVTIQSKEYDKVTKIKKALDSGYFISTGSAFGDWSKIKKTGIYSERADRKFVGHAWSIVDYKDDYFRAVNSYGPTRGIHKGMFKVPFSMVNNIYSCLVFIDKDDSKRFDDLKTKKKIDEMLTIAKELYNNGNISQKKYFERIELSKNIKQLYMI